MDIPKILEAKMKLMYRILKGYKYDVRQVYRHSVPRLSRLSFTNGYLMLQDGVLTIGVGYAWDGPSGPTFDTKDFMRGSLVHDALYQLMRENAISRTLYRKYADQLLRIICLEDGMSKFRAWYVYKFVRMFGKKNSMPRKNPRGQIFEI